MTSLLLRSSTWVELQSFTCNRARITMPNAGKNSLNRSGADAARQQRQEQPEVPGATGKPDDDSPEAALAAARKRRGKTRKHTSDDTPND
jgi:hypothetical protein